MVDTQIKIVEIDYRYNDEYYEFTIIPIEKVYDIACAVGYEDDDVITHILDRISYMYDTFYALGIEYEVPEFYDEVALLIIEGSYRDAGNMHPPYETFAIMAQKFKMDMSDMLKFMGL